MTILVRGHDTVELSALLWEALQVYARQAGWQPGGSVGIEDRRKQSVYTPGRVVLANDARHFAAALERVVNGEAGDELELAAIVGLVNFLRGGAFEIR